MTKMNLFLLMFRRFFLESFWNFLCLAGLLTYSGNWTPSRL